MRHRIRFKDGLYFPQFRSFWMWWGFSGYNVLSEPITIGFEKKKEAKSFIKRKKRI